MSLKPSSPRQSSGGECVGEGMGRYPDAVEVMKAEGLGEHLPGA